MMRLPAELVSPLRRAFEGRRVCVTGGAGFIGGHLVDCLHSLGAVVAVIDDLSNSTAAHLGELVEIEPDRIRFVHASILDDDALRDAVEGAEAVFHLAAIGSVPRSIDDPSRTWAVNATGTLRVLDAARRASARRVVLAASSSAYGESDKLPKHESMAPSPKSPYAAAKLAAEHLMAAWSASYGIDTVSLRYFNVFGPRQPASSAYAAVVPRFIASLLASARPVIFGDGLQTRDFTFVANAVLATLQAGAAEGPLGGEVFNIGTGRRVAIAELAAMLAQLCARQGLAPEHQPARPGEVRHSLADITRARERLGYRPVVSLETGLQETLAWFQQASSRPERTDA